jgi:NAD(P)-dependent dehydrogenase (short-subunit alcohol dehydrogenase family)
VDLPGSCLAETALVRACPADVTAADAPRRIFDACRDAWGEAGILVNNAGRGNARSAAETGDADLDAYLDVNLRAVFRLSREFVTRRSAGPGMIVNIASVFGETGFPGAAPYSAAKAGVIGLTRQMAADYGPRGFRINAIAPGLIATPATRARIEGNARFRMLTIGQIPCGRPGLPSEIASVAEFLCSGAASYINGQVLTVDGGWTATRTLAPEYLPE